MQPSGRSTPAAVAGPFSPSISVDEAVRFCVRTQLRVQGNEDTVQPADVRLARNREARPLATQVGDEVRRHRGPAPSTRRLPPEVPGSAIRCSSLSESRRFGFPTIASTWGHRVTLAVTWGARPGQVEEPVAEQVHLEPVDLVSLQGRVTPGPMASTGSAPRARSADDNSSDR